MGTSTISGDLTICANGEITQSGAISANSGGSTTTLSTGGITASIILPNAANDFETVIIKPNEALNVTIADANNLSLSLIIPGTITATVAGSLTQIDPFIAGGGQSIVNDVSALVSVISYIELSAPTLTSSGFAAAEIDPSMFEDVLPPGSIWTSSLQEPFPKKRRVLKL